MYLISTSPTYFGFKTTKYKTEKPKHTLGSTLDDSWQIEQLDVGPFVLEGDTLQCKWHIVAQMFKSCSVVSVCTSMTPGMQVRVVNS